MHELAEGGVFHARMADPAMEFILNQQIKSPWKLKAGMRVPLQRSVLINTASRSVGLARRGELPTAQNGSCY